MNSIEVLQLLEANKNARGIDHWNCIDQPDEPLTSFGIGLTQLRKLAKRIGRNHDLAQELWQGRNYDAKVIGLLIDEPKKLTRDQAEIQVDQLEHGMLVHVFASCDATLAKTHFVVELSVTWMRHEDPIRRRCGYGLLYEISKDKRKNAPDDAFFVGHIDYIHATYKRESQRVRFAMGGALMGVGKRNRTLNAAALVVAREMGDLPGEKGCEPFSVVKHLTSDYLVNKLGL